MAEFKHNSFVIRTQDLQQTLSKDERLSWTSPEPQSEGDSYKIDLGKDRVIDGIEFYEKHPSNEFPHKWRLLLLDEWAALVTRPIDGEEGKRIIEEFAAVKLRAIQVVIRQPMLKEDGTPYHWRIQNVHLREVKLFHRYYRKRI